MPVAVVQEVNRYLQVERDCVLEWSAETALDSSGSKIQRTNDHRSCHIPCFRTRSFHIEDSSIVDNCNIADNTVDSRRSNRSVAAQLVEAAVPKRVAHPAVNHPVRRRLAVVHHDHTERLAFLRNLLATHFVHRSSKERTAFRLDQAGIWASHRHPMEKWVFPKIQNRKPRLLQNNINHKHLHVRPWAL